MRQSAVAPDVAARLKLDGGDTGDNEGGGYRDGEMGDCRDYDDADWRCLVVGFGKKTDSNWTDSI